MTATARKLPELMTVTEFLAWKGDGTRYDLVDGELRAHAAPADIHGRMIVRVGAILTAQLDKKRRGCSVGSGSGVQPTFRADWNFRQPDLYVTCTPNTKDFKPIPDPVVIIEMLSPSNASDTWDNVRNYMSVPSVKEIVLFHTTRAAAELLVRDAAGAWPANPIEIDETGTITLASVDVELPVIAAYRGTHLGRDDG
jgi:Uma2 family endonuclease